MEISPPKSDAENGGNISLDKFELMEIYSESASMDFSILEWVALEFGAYASRRFKRISSSRSSSSGTTRRVLRLLLQYAPRWFSTFPGGEELDRVMTHKLRTDRVVSDAWHYDGRIKSNKQHNSIDCGVVLCLNALKLAACPDITIEDLCTQVINAMMHASRLPYYQQNEQHLDGDCSGAT